MALAPGETFGRYLIEKPLGQGGMGQVFRAVDTTLERPVALKIVRPDRADEEAVARFFREAKLAAQLTHPNTVQVYDVGERDGIAFLAMELVEGFPLTRYCGTDDARTETKLRWMIDIARGLGAAHRKWLIHRDVKPSNVMVSADGIAKLVDFGLAKRKRTSQRFRATFHTQLGFVVGTPQYMAPEQLAAESIDATADQFAWSLTVYTLLLGRNPRGMDLLMLDELPKLAGRIEGADDRLDVVLRRACSTLARDRFGSMDLAAKALEAALKPRAMNVVVAAPPAPRAPSPKPPPTPPTLAEAEPTRISREPPEVRANKWRFERITEPCPIAPLGAAAFSPDGRAIYGFPKNASVNELSVFRRLWIERRVPAGLVPSQVRCAFAEEDGSVVVAGAQSRVARHRATGELEDFAPPRALASPITFTAIDGSDFGFILCGRTDAGDGIFARIDRRGRLSIEPTPHHLVAATRIKSGSVVACTKSALLVFARYAPEPIVHEMPNDKLFTVARNATGAFVAGKGGRILRFDAPNDIRREDARTTTTLCAFACNGDDAWAASDSGRLVRRNASGVWERMSPEWRAHVRVLALSAGPDRVRAVCEDGSILAGWRTQS